MDWFINPEEGPGELLSLEEFRAGFANEED